MSRDEVHVRDRLLMLAESTGSHKPFNVKRKPATLKVASKNGPKLSVQDFVRMDPGYTPDIEHLVFPARKRNPQQVAPLNPPTGTSSQQGKTRSRLAEMFALSRHLQQRSVDRDSKPRSNVVNRSVDSVLEPPRLQAPRTNPDSSQRWIVEEPVRQNSSTSRVSPAKDVDMAATRGPNVSVLHLRGPSEWDTSPTTVFAATTTTGNSRSYNRNSTSCAPLTKHQSLGGYNQYKYGQQSFHSSGNDSSSEIYLGSSCHRELSPVRWCDKEVDGVYLGRSGWVQVQQRSLDDRRTSYATSDSLQSSRRIGIKLADYHCKSEPGKCPEKPNSKVEAQRPAYLPLRTRDYEIIQPSKTPSPRSVPESFSPPSITPIISPPPAFQDRNQKGKSRTFFGKPPFLPRSNAIVDSDVSPPPSPQVTSTWNPPQRKSKNADLRSYPRIPQTKSLEDTTANRRTQFVQKYGESSSSSSSSMGFRSLDSYVPRVAMPRLSENTDSSIDVYEDADDEDNNSSSVMSVVNVEVHRPKEKASPSSRPQRSTYRSQTRKSPAGSDSNRHSGCPSPTSSTSSSGEFPSGTMQQLRRSAPARQYQIQEDPSLRVRRSRSLQLPDKKNNYRNPVKISPQQLQQQQIQQQQIQQQQIQQQQIQQQQIQHTESHRVVVKIPERNKRSKEEVSEEMIREAEVVTGFIYGSRSRAAAQALLMQRYNNARDEKTKEPIKPNNGYNIYIVGNKDKKVLQRGSTTPNLTKVKSTTTEVKKPCTSDTCDFWPHCAHRDSLTNQSMMRISHSYPTHQRSLEKSSPESTKPQPKRLSRADTDVRYQRRPTQQFETKRLSPIKSSVVQNDRKCSPVNVNVRGVSPVSRNPSSSSTSSDLYLTTSDRASSRSPKNAKSSGASTPLEDVPKKDEPIREMVLTRPGSAPNEEKKSVGFEDAQQRSLSLPKSFLSGTYQQQECQIPWRKKGAESLTTSPGLNRRTQPPTNKAQTAPVTPLHDGNRRRSPIGGASRKAKATSTPQLLDPADVENRKWDEKQDVLIENRLNPKEYSTRRHTATGQTTESVLQKFRKTFSLRFQKKGSKESCSTDFGENLQEVQDQEEETIQQRSHSVSPSGSQLVEVKDEHPEQKYKFGPLVWRTSKERKKLNKAARNAKCNSGDSGIQIEMVPACGGTGGDSSESHDTDQPCDDLDSPPTVRRRAPNRAGNGRSARPHSDLINQILIDRFKAELKSRSHRRPYVRRTHSDLGGQRILHWETRSSHRRLMTSPITVKGRPQSPRKRPPDLPGAVQLRGGPQYRRGQLRRSLSQPLDIDKLSPLMRLKTTSFRNGGGSSVVSEDEHDRGTSDDDMMSDSESSVASLSENRKKSLDLAMDLEEMVVLAEAVFDHVAIEAEELAFRAGDVIEVQTTSNKDWWWGACDGKTGWFPAAFVRLRVSQEDTVEDCLAAMANGRSVSGQIRRRTSISLLSNDQVRTSVVRELVHTERDFVKVLHDVAEGYVAECRKRTEMFTEEQIASIFINLEDILRFQSGFLKDLESSIDWEAPHKSCVGTCFIKHKEGFTMYSDYCNSHPIATATLQELYQFNSYSKFFEACRLMRGLIEIPLDGYLLTPVQRICKYPLQLAELLKYTKTDHEDYEHIKEALAAMRGVAMLINERKRRMESLEKLAAWQQRVEGWEGEDLIEKSTQLIHQGEIIRVTTGVWTSSLTLFLFDHQLIYCKKDILKRNTYVYKGRIHLDTTEVIDVPDGKDTHIGVSVRHAIRLYSVIRDKWLLFCCRSASDKQHWLEAFLEERRLVAKDKLDGTEFPNAAKQLARMAAKCQRRPPRKPGGKHYKNDSIYVGSMLQLNSQNSNSLGRKVGTWFTFGGNKKARHHNRDVS
ncbi:uncharacterized protein [Onthophagus taurus]|uniref:uncharacterized protein n=1 Tax=Onthophagus taurus TaxID=166361 RepID=UPI0039BE5064